MQQARDLVLQASLQEFLDRLPSGQPLVCAECPGWVCYAVVLPMLTSKAPFHCEIATPSARPPGESRRSNLYSHLLLRQEAGISPSRCRPCSAHYEETGGLGET